MIRELPDVFVEASRVLVLELDTRRPVAIGGGEARHAFLADDFGIGARLGLELAYCAGCAP
jgi:hypothetical protein